jgi:hypothetical protein
MEHLCEFAIMNIDNDINNIIHFQCFTDDDFYELDYCIKIITEKLGIELKAININDSNISKQRKTVISFKFKNRLCEFYEHFDTQRDYICIRIHPIS